MLLVGKYSQFILSTLGFVWGFGAVGFWFLFFLFLDTLTWDGEGSENQ